MIILIVKSWQNRREFLSRPVTQQPQEEASDTFDIDKFEAEMDEAQSAETSSRRQKPLGADGGGEGVEEGIEAINHQERSADNQSGAVAASESSQQVWTLKLFSCPKHNPVRISSFHQTKTQFFGG